MAPDVSYTTLKNWTLIVKIGESVDGSQENLIKCSSQTEQLGNSGMNYDDCHVIPSGFAKSDCAYISRSASVFFTSIVHHSFSVFWATAFLIALFLALPTLAQAQTSAAVGQVETLTGGASAIRSGGKVDTLQVGTRIFNGDIVQTGSNSRLGITFLDQTVFSLSSNARMVIDDLVYRPGGTSNKMLVNLAEGTFVFLAGKIASTGDMKVETRVTLLGIRGTQPWVAITPGVSSFAITAERNGKTGEYSMLRKGTSTVIATVNLATVGTTKKYIMSSPNDTPLLVDKTPAELQREPQLKRDLFATLQARDARLRNGSIQNPNDPTKTNSTKQPDYGWMFNGVQPYFEIGGGLNYPEDNREFEQFGQSVDGNGGVIGFGEAGLKWNNVFGNIDVSTGIVGQFQNWNHQAIVNTQGSGSEALNGTTQAISIFPRITFSGPISEYTSWRAGVGGGVAFQKLDATDNTGGAVSGSKTTAMVNVNGGVGYMLMPGVDIWLNGYATWLEGFNVATNTNVQSRYNSQWNAGATLSLRFSLQPPSPR